VRRLEPKRASPPRGRRETRHAALIAAAEQLAVMPGDGNAWGTGASIGGWARTDGGSGDGHGTGRGAGDGTDQRPACVHCPRPRYPFIARARGWQGSVSVGLLVLADGTVDAASVRHSSGYGVLDEAAIAVARRSRFSPPAAQGLPAPLHGRIEYRFELTAPR
jgi:TonB family protein